MMVQVTANSGSHLARAAPSLLPSPEDIEAEVMETVLFYIIRRYPRNLLHSGVRNGSSHTPGFATQGFEHSVIALCAACPWVILYHSVMGKKSQLFGGVRNQNCLHSHLCPQCADPLAIASPHDDKILTFLCHLFIYLFCI